jgi:hypothetical protein
MPDSLAKAIRYKERAAECDKLADLAADDQIREHYQKLGDDYLVMAQTELKRAEQEAGRKRA